MSGSDLERAVTLALGPLSEPARRGLGRPRDASSMAGMVRSAIDEAMSDLCGPGLGAAWVAASGRDRGARDPTLVEIEAVLRLSGKGLVDLARLVEHKVSVMSDASRQEDLP